MAVELRDQLKAGHHVVVDHGFWSPKDRDKCRAIATHAGATPVLFYLVVSHNELCSRLNKRDDLPAHDPNSNYFSESALQRYRTRFFPPQADEPPPLHNGDAAALEASPPSTQNERSEGQVPRLAAAHIAL